ncbi:MAG: TatD family hydrolase [Synergistaceae bacterium]|jgi:TatD DNase family protein|nr:TatD family hydrolase [Synergistaceae bacterium]
MNEEIKFFDSHCHLNMEEFSHDVADALSCAHDAGVRRAMLVACDEPGGAAAVLLSERYKERGVELMASVGIHPHEAASAAKGLPDGLQSASRSEKVSAIGETGLDYYYDNSPRELQRRVFEIQLELASAVKKPIIIHLRDSKERRAGDAYGEAMSIMKDYPDLNGVIHCFSGNIDDARSALDMGFYISFAGPITYPKATELREAAVYIPMDRILCETDSPYLAPQSKRGKRNEPAFVRDVYAKIAEIRGISLEKLAKAVWRNGENLFGPSHCGSDV